MRSLFITGATVIPVPAGDDAPLPSAMDIESYIERLESILNQHDFFETWSVQNIEVFENISTVISTYEARANINDAEPLKRGINLIHLYKDGKRWKFVNMLWKDNTSYK
ncbi:MAG: hypothetical protein V3V99_04745 [candidate division Zixibacteria bacterium]